MFFCVVQSLLSPRWKALVNTQGLPCPFPCPYGVLAPPKMGLLGQIWPCRHGICSILNVAISEAISHKHCLQSGFSIIRQQRPQKTPFPSTKSSPMTPQHCARTTLVPPVCAAMLNRRFALSVPRIPLIHPSLSVLYPSLSVPHTFGIVACIFLACIPRKKKVDRA